MSGGFPAGAQLGIRRDPTALQVGIFRVIEYRGVRRIKQQCHSERDRTGHVSDFHQLLPTDNGRLPEATDATLKYRSPKKRLRFGRFRLAWGLRAPSPSDKSRDRLVLRGRIRSKVEKHFIDVAPTPPLGRIVALDDRMLGGMEVLRGMPPGRLVAASDMTASPANPQVHPGAAGF